MMETIHDIFAMTATDEPSWSIQQKQRLRRGVRLKLVLPDLYIALNSDADQFTKIRLVRVRTSASLLKHKTAMK